MADKEKIQSYRDLEIWHRTKTYAIHIYKVTKIFPPEEKYGLVSQIRRAAVSIPLNIAEGFRRGSRKEKVQFLRHAFGSGAELETQLEISLGLEYLDQFEYEKTSKELDEIMRILNTIIRKLSV